MNGNEFYEYIMENFNLDGAACRLVRNIIYYVEARNFTSQKEVYLHLNQLLGGAIGLYNSEIMMCRFNCLHRMEVGGLSKREISITWSIEDVAEIRPDLTEDQAFEVLESVLDNHNAEFGVCWDTLEFWADSMFPRREIECSDDAPLGGMPEKWGESDG